MNTEIQQIKQAQIALQKEILATLQNASETNNHLFRIKDIANLVVHFGETYTGAKLTANIFVEPQYESVTDDVIRALLDIVMDIAGYEKAEVFTGYRTSQAYVLQIEFAWFEKDQISYTWDAIEDLSGCAVYEPFDLPDDLVVLGRSYKLISSNSELKTATYQER